MRTMILRTGLALCACAVLLSTGAGEAAAQNGEKRSSRSGVYTKAQAKLGSDVFALHCTSCHTPEAHTSATFRSGWASLTLWDLFIYLTYQMPQTDPGSLSPEEYAQLVAYVLELNGMPPGETALPTDSAKLSAIRFDTIPASKRSKR